MIKKKATEYMNQKFKWIIWNKLLLFSSWSSYKLVWTRSSKYNFICKVKQTKGFQFNG